MLTLENMQHQWGHGDQHIPGLLEGIASTSAAVFTKYGLTTSLTVAHALAQFSEECGAGLEMIENLNYTEQRLLQVFPTHFTVTLAAKAAHNPEMIAEIAYGGRMGNAPPPSTDGWVYRGQGLSQCTGKNEYKALGEKVGTDLVANPGWLTDPQHALECGVADFVLCGCLPFAEKDDVLSVTKHLNGGVNGLVAREQWLRQWKKELGVG
jgi:putative chitinase